VVAVSKLITDQHFNGTRCMKITRHAIHFSPILPYLLMPGLWRQHR
jgi:hypothetical protein